MESDGRRVAGVEIKAAGSVSQGDFKGLAFLRDKLKDRFAMGVVLYDGKAVVREGGVEPPRPFGHTDLNRARLPIPPLAREAGLGYPTGPAVPKPDGVGR